MSSTILGIHHVTAVSGRASENLAFYEGTLGLRLVKKTVNFDDPGSYHLYYGDREGSPGTLVTFFPFDVGPSGRGRVGPGQMSETVYGLGPQAWQRFREEKSSRLGAAEGMLFGRRRLTFEDPHGLPLVVEETADGPAQLGPFVGATLWVERPQPTREVLELLGYSPTECVDERQRFTLSHRPEAGYLDLAWSAGGQGRPGPGTVHHLALAVADPEVQRQWRQAVQDAGLLVSPVRDRTYFESIYFREPGGILFEIATVPPGMTVDESLEELGSNLRLPPQYEPYRARIEARLEPLESSIGS